MATAKQIAFIEKLLSERDMNDIPEIRERIPTLDTRQASAWIDKLLKMPKVVTATDTPIVPAGRYAVDTDEGHLGFYRIWRPEDNPNGPYALYVMASDEQHRIRGEAARTIMRKIEAAGPKDAAIRYGREIGKCSICGRTLTDENSRAAGIGPVCAENVGW